MRPVFITRCTLRVPGISSFEDLGRAVADPGLIRPSAESLQVGAETLEFARTEQPVGSPYYPEKRDLKVMRSDVIALTLCARELLGSEKLTPAELDEAALYVATGICLNDLAAEIARTTSAFLPSGEERAAGPGPRNQRVTEAAHPLFALKALTNAGETYVAQYARILGHNTTFGNSSHSAYDALDAGYRTVASGRAEKAFVAAANGNGAFTFLTYRNFCADSGHWREGNGAVFLMLESEQSLRSAGREPLARLDFLRTLPVPPDVEGPRGIAEGPFFDWIPVPAEACFFGGCLSSQDHAKLDRHLMSRWKAPFSWYPAMGTLGVADLLLHVASALVRLREPGGATKAADCLNLDPYGKQAWVRLAAPSEGCS